jgi:molybdenum cofactor guanylyltransferase
MTGVILAGGESTRMGRNKALIEFQGQRIIERTLALFNTIFDQVLLVTNAPLTYVDLDVRMVTDLVPGKGSLGGIYTGLFYAPSPQAFFVGCDMPLLNRDVILYFLRLAESADIVVERCEDYWEPLHAVYSRKFLKPIERLMEHGELKIIEAYKWMKLREVEREELEPLDPGLRSLVNVNTPEDLKKVMESCKG